jgi:hypothetical protein
VCECCLSAVINGDDAVLCHDGVELLLVVGDAGWQRREVPVQTRVALLAAQAREKSPLTRDNAVEPAIGIEPMTYALRVGGMASAACSLSVAGSAEVCAGPRSSSA